MANAASLIFILPELALMLTILTLMVCDFFASRSPRLGSFYPWISVGGLLLAVLALVGLLDRPAAPIFMGMMAHDPMRLYVDAVVATAAVLVILISRRSDELHPREGAEYHSLLVALTLGCFLFASASHLLMVYLALEFVSVLSYILSGFMNPLKNSGTREGGVDGREPRRAFREEGMGPIGDRTPTGGVFQRIQFMRKGDARNQESMGRMLKSSEAALKYVIYGGVASGVMLFGISLIYGLTGTLDLSAIRGWLITHATDRLVLFVAITMALAGFGYKIAAFPFHMWCPDVYEGAPTPIAAFLSIAPKGAGFAALIRFFLTALAQPDGGGWTALKYMEWPTLLAVVSVATMTLGNLAALPQRNMKRMLAYSSIAHAGYMLMGLVALNAEGVQAILFYLAVYLLMNLGAFFMVIVVRNHLGTEEIEGYKGLGRRPGYGSAYAIIMSLFLFSLTGIPPFAGFIGKFYLFGSVVKAGLVWLAVLGVLNSVVSLYYYVRIVKFMFFDPSADGSPMPRGQISHGVVLAGLGLATLYLGLFWNPLARAAVAGSQMWMK